MNNYQSNYQGGYQPAQNQPAGALGWDDESPLVNRNFLPSGKLWKKAESLDISKAFRKTETCVSLVLF